MEWTNSQIRALLPEDSCAAHSTLVSTSFNGAAWAVSRPCDQWDDCSPFMFSNPQLLETSKWVFSQVQDFSKRATLKMFSRTARGGSMSAQNFLTRSSLLHSIHEQSWRILSGRQWSVYSQHRKQHPSDRGFLEVPDLALGPVLPINPHSAGFLRCFSHVFKAISE